MVSVAAIKGPMDKMLEREEAVRKVLLDAYEYDGVDSPANEARLYATDCAQRLFNVLYTVRNPGDHTGYAAVMDLTVNLSGNPFWVKNGPVLMPLLHMALAAQADYAALLYEKQGNPNITKDDDIRAECKYVGLELFPMIAFLLSGQELMVKCSLRLKQRLAPLLG